MPCKSCDALLQFPGTKLKKGIFVQIFFENLHYGKKGCRVIPNKMLDKYIINVKNYFSIGMTGKL